jgi:glycerol-3-phosphate acyltransferase PlsY
MPNSESRPIESALAPDFLVPLDPAVFVIAYLIGSVSSAILVSRLRGLADPRSFGSGNPGATNMLRTGDKKAAALTLIGDAGKGAIAVLLAAWVGPEGGSSTTLALAAIGVFLGHLFPVFFGFKGGKGVATALGVLLALSWPVGLAILGAWLLVFVATKISSLSALTASAIAPLVWFWVHGMDTVFWSVLAMTVLLLIRHHKNIRDLLSGSEAGFGGRKDDKSHRG